MRRELFNVVPHRIPHTRHTCQVSRSEPCAADLCRAASGCRHANFVSNLLSSMFQPAALPWVGNRALRGQARLRLHVCRAYYTCHQERHEVLASHVRKAMPRQCLAVQKLRCMVFSTSTCNAGTAKPLARSVARWRFYQLTVRTVTCGLAVNDSHFHGLSTVQS